MQQRASVSRRGFLATGAAGFAGVSVSGCGAAEESGRSAGVGTRSATGLRLATPVDAHDDAWAQVRSRFVLEPGVAYMNNASLGMPPASVAEAVGAGYEVLSQEPLRAKNALSAAIADRVTPGLAALLGADTDEIALTRNASEALHLAAFGVRLRRGDEVLVTSQEHPAGLLPWEVRAARDGIQVSRVAVPSPLNSPGQVVELMEDAITPATRVVAFCHVTRGGHLYPVRQLCALARERGCTSHVDGAQAVGMLPVDLRELGCDTYSASLHKWFLGPMGTGVLYVRASARERVESVFATEDGSGGAAYRPPGTAPLPLRAALGATLEFMKDVTVEAVEARTRYLSNYLKSQLTQIDRCMLLSGNPEVSCPGSTIFELDGVDAVKAVGLVAERARIHIDEHQRDGHNAIRVSTHIYNTQGEIDRLVAALEGL